MLTYQLETEAGKVFASGMLGERAGDGAFKSGNEGWFGTDKTALPKVAHLTSQKIRMTLKDGERVIGSFVSEPRLFKTGSYGYWGGGKCFTNQGLEVQAQVQLVLVKSKGVIKDMADKLNLVALNNKYQIQAQAVLLNGMTIDTPHPDDQPEVSASAA